MSGDELFIVSPLDQGIQVDTSFVEWVRGKVYEAVDEKNVDIIMGMISSMIKVSRQSGIGLACALYLTQLNWDKFEIDDEFEDYIHVVQGLHRHTIDRYVSVWAMYENSLIPMTYIEQIKQHNIKAQIPIAKALDQGFEIDEEHWRQLAQAPDQTSVSKIVREIKGSEPRKGSLQIFMDRDGSLKVYYENEIYDAGFLDISSEELAIQKAVDRIVSNSGILRR